MYPERRKGETQMASVKEIPEAPILSECGYCGSPDLCEIPTDPECWDGKLYECRRCGKANTVYPAIAA